MAGRKRKRNRLGRVLPKKAARKPGGQDLLDRFALYLYRRRTSRNLSIRQFAKNAGLPHTNVFQMEACRKNPRLTELELLAKAYHETISKFLEPIQRDISADSAEDARADLSATSGSIAGQNSQII